MQLKGKAKIGCLHLNWTRIVGILPILPSNRRKSCRTFRLFAFCALYAADGIPIPGRGPENIFKLI